MTLLPRGSFLPIYTRAPPSSLFALPVLPSSPRACAGPTMVTTNAIFFTSVALFLSTTLFFFIVLRLLGQRPSPKGEGQRPRLPPGPIGWPIVGSLVAMLRHQPHFRWVLGLADGKDITCVRLGPVHVVVVNSPELGLEFLKKHDATFASRPLTMATEYSGRGFLSAVIAPWGDQWKKMRRVLASEVMCTARLRGQLALRAEESDHFTRYVYNRSTAGADIDMRLAARYYSGNVIRRMIFGVRHFGKGGEHGGPGEEEVEHVEAAFAVLSCIYAFCPSDFIPALRLLDLGGHEQIMKQATRAIYKYHDPIINERLKKWRTWREEGGHGAVMKNVEDILDVFLSLRDSHGKPMLNSEEIRAQTAVRQLNLTIFSPSFHLTSLVKLASLKFSSLSIRHLPCEASLTCLMHSG